MAPKPPSSVDQTQAAADDPAAPELDGKLTAEQIAAARVAAEKRAASSPDDDEDDDELEIDDDEDDEDLVVFTAKEAAGAHECPSHVSDDVARRERQRRRTAVQGEG